MHEEAKSGGSVKRRDGRALVAAPITRAENPPSYGAQQRQDALWNGGNEALPPSWQQYEMGDGNARYLDTNLFMATWKRPLPGVRLDGPGTLLVPKCEWYISPRGRSYFVNHNTQTTSWNKPTPEHPPRSLTPKCVIEGHSKCIWGLAYMSTCCNVMSASGDGSIRQWTRDGETIGRRLSSDGGGVMSIAVSPDDTMVVGGGEDGNVRLWNIKEGRIIGDPWEGHNAPVRCLDWSPSAQEIASGSQDSTIRRWNPDTGRQIASPIETGQGWVYTIKYSSQGDRFASSGSDNLIRVWSKEGELLIKFKGHDHGVPSLCWSKDGLYLFSGSGDSTIRKWHSIDGKELVVLRGHTKTIRSVFLSLDERHLVSASLDSSIRIWDLKTNQLVGEPLLHDDELWTVAMSPDGKYVASAGIDKKINLWDFEAALKHGGDQSARDGNARSHVKPKELAPSSRDILDVSAKSTQLAKKSGLERYGGDFWGPGNDPNRSLHDLTPLASPSQAPRWRNWLNFNFLRSSSRPVDATPPMPRQPRRWNFSLSTRRVPSHTVDVAAAHDEDRYYVTPPTDAEVAAAMQALMGNDVNNSAQQGIATAGVQLEGSQQGPSPVQIAHRRNSVTGTEPSYTIGCCGFYLVIGRRGSH